MLGHVQLETSVNNYRATGIRDRLGRVLLNSQYDVKRDFSTDLVKNRARDYKRTRLATDGDEKSGSPSRHFCLTISCYTCR